MGNGNSKTLVASFPLLNENPAEKFRTFCHTQWKASDSSGTGLSNIEVETLLSSIVDEAESVLAQVHSGFNSTHWWQIGVTLNKAEKLQEWKDTLVQDPKSLVDETSFHTFIDDLLVAVGANSTFLAPSVLTLRATELEDLHNCLCQSWCRRRPRSEADWEIKKALGQWPSLWFESWQWTCRWVRSVVFFVLTPV